MTPRVNVLLVDGDPAVVEAVKRGLQHEERARLLVADGIEKAAALSHLAPPDLILVRYGLASMDTTTFCRRTKANPELQGALLVLLTEPRTAPLTADLLALGVDHGVNLPVRSGELLATYRLAERVAHMRAEIRSARVELKKLRRAQTRNIEQMQAFLAMMLERGVPGARLRGERIAKMAAQIGARFGIPKNLMRDLDVAARLHELGRVAAADDTGAWRHEALAVDDATWRYTQDTKVVLQQVHGLEDAADIVGSIYENWDGTGHPHHLQRGQIPLRSRVLHALIDYVAMCERGAGDRAIARIKEQGGAVYDPLVAAHLEAVVTGGDPDSSLLRTSMIAVTDLREGMVLAEDLYTDSGLELLSRDTVLTPHTLEAIWRRHGLEPIHQGAAIHRASA
jgi:response regulator RpfG family c-di-GMP phosphodiesterase